MIGGIIRPRALFNDTRKDLGSECGAQWIENINGVIVGTRSITEATPEDEGNGGLLVGPPYSSHVLRVPFHIYGPVHQPLAS